MERVAKIDFSAREHAEATDSPMRIFAHLDHLIVLATRANDLVLRDQLKITLDNCLERYCENQRAILEAKIKKSSATPV